MDHMKIQLQCAYCNQTANYFPAEYYCEIVTCKDCGKTVSLSEIIFEMEEKLREKLLGNKHTRSYIREYIHEQMGLFHSIFVQILKYKHIIRSDSFNIFKPFLKKPRILISDSNPLFQQVVQKVISRNGCHVHTAESFSESINILQNYHIDVIIADLYIDGGGLELIREARKIYSNIVTVLITNYLNGQAKSIEALDLDLFLLRPFHVEDIRMVKTQLDEAGKPRK
jgi:CheY-like chemotaxis protein